MANSASIYTRYFVFSQTQMQDKINIASSMSSKKPKLGKVVVNGVARDYTEMVTDMARCRYSDAVLVTKGDIRTIKFTEPEE